MRNSSRTCTSLKKIYSATISLQEYNTILVFLLPTIFPSEITQKDRQLVSFVNFHIKKKVFQEYIRGAHFSTLSNVQYKTLLRPLDMIVTKVLGSPSSWCVRFCTKVLKAYWVALIIERFLHRRLFRHIYVMVRVILFVNGTL